MTELNILVCCEHELLEDIVEFLCERNIDATVAQKGNGPFQPHHEVTGDIAVAIVTVYGIARPLIAALSEFHRTRLEHRSKKSFRLTVRGDSLEFNGFDETEIRRLSEWLAMEKDNEQ